MCKFPHSGRNVDVSFISRAGRIGFPYIVHNRGVLLVRFFCLNSDYQRESHFVQGRTLGSHTAKAMLEGFIRSLTVPSKVLTVSDVLSVRELCEKTTVFLADGASSMGVRHKGTVATKAITGDNFFHLLQEKVDAELGAGERTIVGYWCDNHRLDVVASAAETHIAYISDLLKFFRSVIAHIMGSDRARGLLDYMAFLLEPPSEKDEEIIASDGSLSSISFAPQRWNFISKQERFDVCHVAHPPFTPPLRLPLDLTAVPWHEKLPLLLAWSP